jgi:cytochrome c5
LSACTGEKEPPVATTESGEQTAQSESWLEDQLLEGQETYEAACASCHDSGEGGAPVTGKESDWSDRSRMWVAVLSDHAKAGYLDMPGKGGRGELTDESVGAAVEYMMQQTFPKLPTD